MFKAVDGLVEFVVGIPLLLLRPVQLGAIARAVTAGELGEDPDDLVAHLICHGVVTLTGEATVVAAVYLIVHGLVKLGIVAAIFRGSWLLYPWAIAVLGGFVVWQGYEFVRHCRAGAPDGVRPGHRRAHCSRMAAPSQPRRRHPKPHRVSPPHRHQVAGTPSASSATLSG
ncbi:DUF2127 domain-containing protein [Curtobacterium sp. VKM Ac-1395]|nr:DUF2127 domain-containing protein [Curtobacterium sp. VKM Ac-1395]